MKFNFRKSIAALTMMATGLVSASAQADWPGTENGEWHHYTGDIKGSRYSALDQVNADNFEDLELVWSFSTKNLGTRGEYKLEVTPIMPPYDAPIAAQIAAISSSAWKVPTPISARCVSRCSNGEAGVIG